jgi:hypothetical protein
MSDEWGYKLGVLLALLLAAAFTGVFIALFRRLAWWPTLLLQLPYRPGLVFFRMLVLLMGSAVTALLLLPSGVDVGVMILLWLTVVPGLTELWARTAAWKRDEEKDRSDAATIRRSIRARRNDDWKFDDSKPWPDYIVDKARLDRRKRYRPPGH